MDEVNPKRPGSLRDVVIVIAVILIAAVVLGVKIHMSGASAKETALISELRSMRMAVQLYMLENKTPPPDLKVLASQKYDIANKKEPYVRGLKLDKEGYPVDSFGNRFNYNKAIGWVSSSSEKYSKW